MTLCRAFLNIMLNILTIKEMFYNTWIIKNNRRRESIYKFQFNYQTHEQQKTVIKKMQKMQSQMSFYCASMDV